MNEAHSASKTTSTSASASSPRDDHEANPEQATTFSAASTRASSASESGSEIERRRRERQSALDDRRRRRWINAFIVVAPVALALVYVLCIATPRYEAESRFFVQSGSGQQGGGAMAASLLTTGNSGGMLGGFVDGWAVSDFLRSRDSMRQLDKKVGLRHYLMNTGLDPANHLSEDSSEDDLYRAYRASVQVSFNALEQIDVLRVRAYSPQDAETLSKALIGLAEDLSLIHICSADGTLATGSKAEQILMRNQFKLGRHEVAHSLAAGLLGDEIETPEIVRIAAISAGHLGFVDEALGNWKQLFRISSPQDATATEAADTVLSLLQAGSDMEAALRWVHEVRAAIRCV